MSLHHFPSSWQLTQLAIQKIIEPGLGESNAPRQCANCIWCSLLKRWKRAITAMAERWPCKGLREVREAKGGGLDWAILASMCSGSLAARNLVSRMFPSRNFTGNVLGVDQNSLWPRSQNSKDVRKINITYKLLTSLGIEQHTTVNIRSNNILHQETIKNYLPHIVTN